MRQLKSRHQRRTKGLSSILLAGALLTLSACGGGGGGGGGSNPTNGSTNDPSVPDTTAPTVNITPANRSKIGSASNKKPAFTLTFSEAVKNVDDTSVTLSKGNTAVALSVAKKQGNVYTATPKANLSQSASYTLKVSSAIKDNANNALTAVTQIYTTGDLTAPRVISATPLNNATGVLLNTKITLGFSEAVQGVVAANVKVSKSSDGKNPVTATVANKGNNRYEITPSNALEANTMYYVVLSNIKDTANNALSYVPIRFTTAPAPTVTRVSPANNATGIDKRPVFTVTFSEPVRDVNNNNVTLRKVGSNTRVGLNYRAANANKTYGLTPTADLESNARYELILGTGIKSQQSSVNIAQATYRFTVKDYAKPTIRRISPANNSTIGSVTQKRPSFRVTFSESMRRTTLTNANILFRKRGTSANTPIRITIGSTGNLTIQPIQDLDEKSTYDLSFTDRLTDLAGNKLTGTTYNYTTADFTAPTVRMTNPSTANNVAVNTNITLQFSEAVQNVNAYSVRLSKTTSAPYIAATVRSGTTNQYVLTPSAPLAPNTRYFLHLDKTSIKDSSNNPLVYTAPFSFVTASSPIVSNMVPPASRGSATILKRQAFTVTFSQAVQASTLRNNMTLRKNGASSNVALSTPTVVPNSGNKSYRFRPTTNLESDGIYILRLTAGIKSTLGTPLTAKQFVYKVEDYAAPTITSVSPAANTQTIGARQPFTVTFSETVRNVNATNVELRATGASAPIPVSIRRSDSYGMVYTITPTRNLADHTNYTLTLKTGITDVKGIALAINNNFGYKTTDSTPPTVSIGYLPELHFRVGYGLPGGARMLTAIKPTMRLTFSESVKNVNTSNIVVKTGTTTVPTSAYTVNQVGSSNVYDVKITSPLAVNTTYSVTLKNGIKDTANKPLAQMVDKFRTAPKGLQFVKGQVAALTNTDHVVVYKDYLYASQGSADKISQFKIKPNGELVALTTPHLSVSGHVFDLVTTNFSTGTNYLYAVNKATGTNGNKIHRYSIDDATGALTYIADTTVPTTGVRSQTVQEIALSPDSKFAYVIAHGIPYKIYQFSVDASNGNLSPLTPAKVDARVSMASDIVASSNSLYVSSPRSQGVSQFNRNTTTGLLTPKSPAFRRMGSTSTTRGYIPGALALPNNNTSYLYVLFRSYDSRYANGYHQLFALNAAGDMGNSNLANQLNNSNNQTNTSAIMAPDDKFMFFAKGNKIHPYTVNQTDGSLALDIRRVRPLSTATNTTDLAVYKGYVYGVRKPYRHIKSGVVMLYNNQ